MHSPENTLGEGGKDGLAPRCALCITDPGGDRRVSVGPRGVLTRRMPLLNDHPMRNVPDSIQHISFTGSVLVSAATRVAGKPTRLLLNRQDCFPLILSTAPFCGK